MIFTSKRKLRERIREAESLLHGLDNFLLIASQERPNSRAVTFSIIELRAYQQKWKVGRNNP